jgi:hypothetical protein
MIHITYPEQVSGSWARVDYDPDTGEIEYNFPFGRDGSVVVAEAKADDADVLLLRAVSHNLALYMVALAIGGGWDDERYYVGPLGSVCVECSTVVGSPSECSSLTHPRAATAAPAMRVTRLLNGFTGGTSPDHLTVRIEGEGFKSVGAFYDALKARLDAPSNPMDRPIPQGRAEALHRAACDIVDDLSHYVATHGPGPDRRLAALRAALVNLRVPVAPSEPTS